MAKDTQLYYRLYSYRTSPPRERLSVIRHEILTPLGTVRGVAEILSIQLQKVLDIPSPVFTTQKELSQAGEELNSLLEHFVGRNDPDDIRALSPAERVSAFRDQALPQATALRAIAASMRALESDLKRILPKAGVWIENMARATEHIWIIIDGLTNPDLQLPSFLIDWLNIRDTVSVQACNGDSQALEPLLQALHNPEPDIRREAAILLRHLKDERSVPPLIQLLSDEEKEVRVFAADTLKFIGGLEVERALKRYYESGGI